MTNESAWMDPLKQRVLSRIAEDYKKISPVTPQKIVDDVFNPVRLQEQVDQMERDTGQLAGKRILDVGSGYGLLLVEAAKRGASVTGLEPSQDGFYGETLEISRSIIAQAGLPLDSVVDACAEHMPFADGTFDIVHSANVLEHVADPRHSFDEMVRVLKPGGLLHLTVPNYGSFWEGHYVLFWLPYLPKPLGRLYVRLWGRDPGFLDTLQLINYFSLRNLVRCHAPFLEVQTYGERLFAQRMHAASAGSWAGLSKVQKWVDLLKHFKLIPFATKMAIACKAFTPLVLIAKKKGGDSL
ncbi:MAG: class I SAM-dependent methyltransferase [Patescibacteria group bacterium]